MIKPVSLNRQIKDTEQQIREHQHAIAVHRSTLTGELRQAIRLTPVHLLLASGIGFILGELTHCQSIEATDDAPAGETSPLKVAFNLVTTARSLYAALPLVLMISSRYSSSRPEPPQTTKEKFHEHSH